MDTESPKDRPWLELFSPGQRALLALRLGVSVQQATRPAQGLVAFVTSRIGAAIDDHAIRAFLQDRLPEYMVPRSVRVMDELPRTPAGKLDRTALKVTAPEPVMNEPTSLVGARNVKEAILVEVWRDVLGVSELSVDDDFFELGGDSLLSIRILARARKRGLHISPEQFFEYPTIAGQAGAAEETTGTAAESGLVTGRAPLTPIQHWFLEHIPIDPAHWNQSVSFSIRDELDDAVIERALQKVLLHHDGLRVHLERDGEQWTQRFGDTSTGLPLAFADAARVSGDELNAAIEAAAERLHSSFDLACGPMLGVVVFRTAAGNPDRLLLVIHHLLIDAVSWQFLLEDLTTACEQLRRGAAPALPAKTSSLKTWAKRLVDLAASDRIAGQLSWWLGQGAGCRFALPVDFACAPKNNRVATVDTVSLELGTTETAALINNASQAYGAGILDVLLTAFTAVMARWSHSDAVLMDLERHGRRPPVDDIDLSRTLGWLTSVFPLWLRHAAGADRGERIRMTKETLRKMPDDGFGHGLLRYLSPDAQTRAALRAAPEVQVCFNYLGQRGSDVGLFTLAQERLGTDRSTRGLRAYLLDVNLWVVSGRLRMDWGFSVDFHRPETIEQLAREFRSELCDLADFCVNTEAGRRTPSDFPLVDLDQAELDGLSQVLEQLDDDGRTTG